ncbi:hypothetical protein FRC02_003492 [Tulasnella sp. 418]|nr:hypothetical protein FRC02_003492 [Tulasnella sp. 418]
MWAGTHRMDRSVFEMIDTNMLLEAYHHVLKGKFLQGKRNRRLDQLLHVLINEVIPFYAQKQWRQQHGFEGADLEVKMRQKILKKAEVIEKDCIEDLGDSNYTVRSQSDPSCSYDVDMDAFICTCLSFPAIKFCKHIAAIQCHFPLENQLEDCDISSSDTDVKTRQPTLSDLQIEVSRSASASDTQATATHSSKSIHIDGVTTKFHMFTSYLSAMNPVTEHQAIRPLMKQLDDVLDDLISAASRRHSGDLVLPPHQQNIPPNINSKTETQRVLPRARGSKASRILKFLGYKYGICNTFSNGVVRDVKP